MFFYLLRKYFIKQRRLKFNYVVMNFKKIKKLLEINKIISNGELYDYMYG